MRTKTYVIASLLPLVGWTLVADGLAKETSERPPMAEGLPNPLPISAKKPWQGKISLENGVLLRDNTPFFPIGFVFGTDDDDLAQAAAMGCNAVHFEVGWHVATAPEDVPRMAYQDFEEQVGRAGEWGMAAFPLLSGHYVPAWFLQAYPPGENQPLGNDGQPTGSWMPYSLHFPAMREAIQPFWKESAQVLASHPNVATVNFWNEPCYGGTWNKGTQYADYSKWGILAWREDLKKNFPDIQKLNEFFRTSFETWEAIPPPRSPEEFGRRYWLAWLEFGQHSFADFFNFERSVLHGANPDLLLANKKQTNLWDQSSASSGTNWTLLGASEDVSGINMYSASDFASRMTLDAACSYAGNKPVILFETNVMPPRADARTPDAIRCLLWSQLAGGVRGMFIFAMGDDHEHGLLSDEAVNAKGRSEYARVIRDISSHQRELASPRLAGKIGVVYSTTGALQYAKDTIPRYVAGAFDLFRNSHFQVDMIPEEEISETKLSQYRLMVLPSYCVLKSRELQELGAYVKNGGKILSFAAALAVDENLDPCEAPDWLGISTRQSAIGNRENQRLSWTATQLQPYLEGDIEIEGVELISPMVDPKKELVPGSEIKTKDVGQVLAYNSDSYPAILATNNDRIIYCAFRSKYSPSLRGLMEGIAREVLHLTQEVRIVSASNQTTDSGLMIGLRTDYLDADRRYLIVINTNYRARNGVFELEEGWKVRRELLHPEKQTGGIKKFLFQPREVYLFELTFSKSDAKRTNPPKK